MVVENSIIIENKSVEQLLPVHQTQLLTYLRLRNYRLGFLINRVLKKSVDPRPGSAVAPALAKRGRPG
jgi:GxxExxY protein